MEPPTDNITERLSVIRREINEAKVRRGEQFTHDVCLVAASKTKPQTMIIEAYQNGISHFGENYVHEIFEKSNDPEILELCPDIKWHYIGHLQSNKVNKLIGCPKLYSVECIDSPKLADLINKAWLHLAKPLLLNVMIQVNTSKEENKSGISSEGVEKLAQHIIENCHCLHLSGFMTIGSANHDLELGPNPDYQALVNIRDNICKKFSLSNLELSIGMSNDFQHAIELGSAFVRIGEKIFGRRTKNPN